MKHRPISALPALEPSALVPRGPAHRLAFPFCDPRTQYFYLARGAVFHAVKALGLVGAEVLVPAYHHGVEVEALVAAGARPRFYNVKPTFRADLASLAAELTPETKALYVIHYAGFPQPMRDLLSFARGHGLKVIEDCALSLLSSDGALPLGARGDAGIFCLYKTLPVPNGGALWMPLETAAPPLKRPGTLAGAHQVLSSLLVTLERRSDFGTHVRDAVREAARLVRLVRPLPVDARPVGGRTYAAGQERLAISPIALAIAKRLDSVRIVEQRRLNYYALMSRLRELSPPMVHELTEGVSPLFYPFWTTEKRRLQAALADEGIESIDFWREGSPLVTPGKFPDVEALRSHVLELPIHQDVGPADLDHLAKTVHRVLTTKTPRLLVAAGGRQDSGRA